MPYGCDSNFEVEFSKLIQMAQVLYI